MAGLKFIGQGTAGLADQVDGIDHPILDEFILPEGGFPLSAYFSIRSMASRISKSRSRSLLIRDAPLSTLAVAGAGASLLL